MQKLIKLLCVIGTRPEAIKMSPLINLLKGDNNFEVKVLTTGQHTDMLRQALAFFNIKADFDLNIMRERQSLDYITSSVLTGVGRYLDENSQDIILVHGDTSTTFAAALAGFYRKIPVGHVEAGLRSKNIYLPFPEEINRVLADRIASLYFAPTELDAENLKHEGSDPSKIFVTGNTVIDALFWTLSNKLNNNINFENDAPLILMTAHRRESWGEPLVQICHAVKDIINARPDVKFLIPLHKNPTVREVIYKELKDFNNNIIFTEPLDYPDFVAAMNKSIFILSDSGGIQEEASALRKPVLIMRTLSERPQAVTLGTGVLVGTDRNKILEQALKILNNKDYREYFLTRGMPFGDGTACLKIRDIILNYFKF
ncbi:MAG: UDP-N-acetylglucosamine 2-epimerase (non-hydrolyzing) [Synergistaceae bacterium]|nr:UDP-N-acetylglucosamine 2-epimerase (non-hydrolyzing) [Synergistaceae bacterium]MBR0222362.1 UDP-N-acetylglucosamine 2-epimerase (non-hydrolyzing) [Synergistaceae bacterium]